MAASFQRAPSMSRDDMNFRAITYWLRTGPFPDTPWRGYGLTLKLQQMNACFVLKPFRWNNLGLDQELVKK